MTDSIVNIRKATIEAMQEIEGWTADYISEELLAEYEELATEDDSGTVVEGVQALYYYGHHPLWVPDLSRPGYVGRLYFSNGTANRPNDPCGNRFRRRVWFYHAPRGTQYRNCGSFWGLQFINA